MRSYDALRTEQTRQVTQAIENADRRLQEAERDLRAHVEQQRTIEDELQKLKGAHTELDSRQDALKRELLEFERQREHLQRSIEDRRTELRTVEDRADDLRADLKRHRIALSRTGQEIERARSRVDEASSATDAAREGRAAALAHALKLYVAEMFTFLDACAREATAREKYERTRSSYEQARQADPLVRELHAERIELQRLRDSAQVAAVRKSLEVHLAALEGELVKRFPGLLDPPPVDQEPELVETYFWHDDTDDLTYLLLPIPGSCWHRPPDKPDDPRGPKLAQVLWSFVAALGEPVPSIELVDDLVVLEMLGDHTARLNELISVSLAPGRSAVFLPCPLPAELKEALP